MFWYRGAAEGLKSWHCLGQKYSNKPRTRLEQETKYTLSGFSGRSQKRAARRLPLDRMLSQPNFSQVKKRKRLLAIWVQVSRLVIPYPV